MDRLAGRLVRRFRSEPDEPTIAGIEGEDADQLFDALGSETSRAVLAACYEEGRTRSELADGLETSIQNVSYHVDKLESAGLLEAVETRYGENGSEVKVYEPSKEAIVIAAGETGLVEHITEAIERLFAPIVLVGLLSMVVGVLARGPERIGMLGDSGTPAGTTATQVGFLAAVTTFLCGMLVVLVAARAGAFNHNTTGDDRRAGLPRSLFGKDIVTSRQYAVLIASIAFGTFLALDIIAIGAGHRLVVATWLGIQLVVPAGIVLAAVFAYANDGLLASWGMASAPVVGIWGYLVAGELVRGGFEPFLFAFGTVVVVLVVVPVGSVAYLVGRAVAGWRRSDDAESLSWRAMLLLLAHPIVAGGIIAGWLTLSG